ncbi:hemicentin-1 isoform X1 [Bufo bufo]|uniref:hemicentin-1 isoform X1 n=1 Tax=Bufo bufo TaxID=8384 RepID=UPI001ABDEDAB|nr:hemicentin-1 isoform X1 [Bufo bufo]
MSKCKNLSAHLTVLLFLLQLFEQNSWAEIEPDQGETPDGASTLAFVFDVTGSMYDDLVQVIEGASKILETSLSRPKKPLYNFALVPFHDPEIGPVTITTDPETFKNELKELYVQGGGDCPEMSVGAIKIALEISLPGSFIYVFTDARSKDYQLANDVLQLIQQKQSQVVFVLTGDCDDRSHVGYKIYEEIASTSSGQVFHLDKKQVNEVLKWVEEAVQASKVHLVSTDHLNGALHTWEIPFDPSLREVTVSLSGPSPDIELYDPLGKQMKPDTGLNELLNIFNSAKVLNIKEPVPGIWKIKTSSNGRHSVRITGVSTIDFRAGFSNQPTLDFSKTSSRPIQGIPTYVLLNTTGLQHPARIDHLELLTTSGLLLQTNPIKYYPNRIPHEIWNVTEFIPPKEPFFLRITGYDKDGYLFQRASSVSFSNIVPGPPKVSMPKVTPGYYLQPGRIPCYVESLIPVSVHFRRNGMRLGIEQLFQESIEAIWEIANVTSYDEGYYECFAVSTAGSARAQTFLDVNEPPPVLKGSNNITVITGKEAVLICEVISAVRYNLTWWRKALDLRLANAPGIHVLSDNSLKITSVNISDAGEYVCSASSEGGTTEVTSYLIVQEPPKVVVDPKNVTFTKGSGIKLKCFATGYPAPQIVWTHNDIFVRFSTRYILTQDGTFFIKNAMEKDSGVYTCLAANAAGMDRQSSVLVYIEAPVVTVVKKEMLVAVNGETTVECKTTGIPKPQVNWFKGNLQLSTSSLISIENHLGTLTIKNTKYSDAGDYTCVAANEAGSASGQVSLSVGSAPLLIETPDDIAMDIGSDVTLSCTAQGIPEPKITWRKLNTSSASSKPLIYNQKSGILQINNLWVGDDGTYVCEAENYFGKVQSQVTVTLTGLVVPIIGESPHVVNVIEGNQITLPCVLLAGNPLPIRQWLKDNVVVVSNPYVSVRTDGSLHLESAHLQDDGEYACTATNVAGTSKRLTTVNVYVSPIIQHGPQIFSTIEGNAISLPCKASGVPKPSIIWKKRGETIIPNSDTIIIESDGSLFLSSPGGEDSAEYSCTAVNAAGYAARKVQLTVYVKPRIVSPDIMGISKSQTEISVKVGDSVILPCEVKSVPPPFITWAKEAQLISPFSQRHNIHPSGSMKIFETRVMDTGTYTCVATNIAGNVTQSVKLNVYVPPKIQKGPKVIRANVHQSFEITCVSNGIPLPKTTWFKDGRILEMNETLKDTTFRVDSAELPDAGLYTCIASNLIGQDYANVTVEIRAPPTLSNLEPPYDETNQERISNQWVAFPCPAIGTPKPVIKWLHNNKELTGAEPGVNITKDGTLLIINSLTPYDNGEYKCVAANEVGLTEKKYNLKVNDPPAIKEKEKLTNISVLLNHDVNLYCDATGSPPPLITWYNGTTQVVESNNVLVLEKGKIMKILKATYSGYFTCTATNIAGSSEKQFFVNVLDPPEIAGSESIRNVSVIAGNEAKLECRVKGKPFPHIHWLKDNRLLVVGDPNLIILENGQVLYIKNTHPSDSGYYKCVASNSAGSQTKESKLTVFVPPSIKDGNSTTELSFIVNSEIILECDARGIPHPTMTWNKDGETILPSTRVIFIKNGKYLQISEAKRTDSGKFTCHVVNVAGRAEKVYVLNIFVPATIDGDLRRPQDKKVITGKPLILECEARGHPLPLITWLKDGVPVETNDNIRLLYNGKKLEIKNTAEQDQGRYTCVATNIAGETELKYNVHVLVPPSIEDTDNLGEYIVIANNPIELECYVTGTPIPTVRWLKNGIPLDTDGDVQIHSNGQKLVILESESSDSGSYECIAKNDAGATKKQFRVNVYVRPSIKPEQSPISVLMLRSVALQCIATGIPSPHITWLKNGLPFNVVKGNIRVESFGRILQFKSALLDDDGKYTCVATNGAGEVDQSIVLNVYEPPNIEHSGEVVYETVIADQHVTLECKASGKPNPVLTWSKDNHPIIATDEPSVTISDGGQKLHITSAQPFDAGVYKCVASSIAGSADLTYVLQVHVSPSIFGSNEPIIVIVNNPVRLECEATGFPAPGLTWLKDGRPVSSFSGGIQITSGGRVLTLTNAQVGDSGTYTCVALNAAGEQQVDFHLSVLVPPNIMGEEQNVSVLLSETLVLKCESNTVPPPVLTWYKDWSQLVTRPGVKIYEDGSVLQIEDAQVKDTGRYSCEAVNIAGKTEKNFNVNILVPPKIKGSAEESVVTVIEGSLISLVCDSSGIPAPTLTWTKNGSPLNPDGSGRIRYLSGGRHLQISVAMKMDEAVYTCSAINSAGIATQKYNVTVYVRPTISESGKVPIEIAKIQGNNLTLQCESSGDPVPMLTWLRDGTPLLSGDGFKLLNNGRELHLENIQLLHSGHYVCVALNVAGQADKKYDLRVLVPPAFSGKFQEYENVSVVEKNPVTLTCEVSGLPPPKITWYKDDYPITSDQPAQVMSGGAILRFLHTSLSDAGRYRCVVSNAAGEKSKNFQLNVLVLPRFTENTLEDVKLKEKSDVTLSCEVTGNPTPQLTWVKDGQPLHLESHYRLRIEGQTLQINGAMVSDAGIYVCIASNSAGDKSRRFSLNVMVSPTILGAKSKDSPEELYVILHTSVSLSCHVNSHPPASITWFKDGFQVNSKDNIRILPGGHTLQILKAQEDHSGSYTCIAANEAGKDEHHYNLKVYVPPQIKKDDLAINGMFSKLVKVKINTNFTLECEVKAFPTATVTWYKNGQPLDPKSLLQISGYTLHVDEARLSDTGRYTCVASNIAGEDEKDFDVIVQVPPTFSKLSGILLNADIGMISNNGDNKDVIINNPLSLYCETNAVPPPTIRWYKDGNVLTSNDKVFILPGGHSLQIARTNLEDAGLYTCVAVNEAGEDSLHYNIRVLLPPTFEDITENLSEEITSLENQTVLLNCTVKGHPAPTITWQKDGQVIEEGGHYEILSAGRYLQIKHTQLTDSGRYVCIVENVAGNAEKMFNLNINVPPRIIGSIYENITVVEDNFISLTCEVTGYPLPLISWVKEGIVLRPGKHLFIVPGGRILQIHQTKLADAGEYICVATNQAGKTKKTFSLNVYVPPTIVSGNRDSSPQINIGISTSTLLKCIPDGIPTPVINWYKNGQLITDSTDVRILQKGQVLNIDNAQVSDTGEYQCIATNVVGQDSKTFFLTVHVPPGIQGPPVEYQMGTIKNPVTFSCDAYGIPTPTLIWLKDGSQIDPSDYLDVYFLAAGSKFKIDRAQLSSRGNYTCIASNTEGTAQKDYILTIQVPPSITGSGMANEINALPAEDIQLLCEASGIPRPVIYWLKDGERINSDLRPEIVKTPNGEVLSIVNTQTSDMGKYTCVATNSVGEDDRIFTVNVHVPPKIIDNQETPVKLTAILGTSINIECLVTGVPTPQINWLKNGLPLLVTSQVRLLSSGQMLRISRVQKSDEGAYTCLTSNRAGVDKKHYSLQVYVSPHIDDADKTEQLTTVKGNPTIMSCLASGQPVPHISWLKDGKAIDHGERRGMILQILNTEMSDIGRYSCVASNDAGSVSKHFILNVLEPPHINGSENTEELSVVVNHQLDLHCHTMGFPPPVITWLKDGQILSQTETVHFMNAGQILRITSAQEEHNGLYSCLVSNQAGEAKKEFAVTVHMPPSIAGIGRIHNITVLQNKQIVLECKSDALPAPEITWMKDDKPLVANFRVHFSPDGQYMHIDSAQVADTGQYACIASNVAGRNTREFQLNVHVPPSIKDGPALITTFRNEPATLDCVATGIPSPRISWRKDGTILHENSERYNISGSGSLYFPLTDITDSGHYVCLATNVAGSSQRKTELLVYEPPSISPGTKNITVVVNKQTTLSCDVTGTPKPLVEWKKNGNLLSTDINQNIYRLLSSGSLIVISPTVDDTGTYLCSASNDAGHDELEVSLTVLVPPSIADEVTNIFVSKSSTALLPCTVYGVPHPAVYWSKDGIFLPAEEESFRILASGSIEIARAELSHAGTYTCKAVNEVGTAQININLHVQEVPVIQNQADYMEASINHLVTLSCEAIGTPSPTLTWQKEGVTIKAGSHNTIISKGKLQILKVRQEDAGTYTCIAQNPAGTALGKIKLKVYEPPAIKPHYKEYSVSVDESLTMLCEAYGNPEPEISWFKDGSPLSGQRIISNGALQIAFVQPDDAGQYTCEAENIAGYDRSNMTLTVLIPPQIIKNVKDYAVTHSVQVTIPCTAHGIPTPTISWKKNNVPMVDTTGKYEVLASGQLVLLNVENKDAGNYTCTAINDVGKDLHTVSLVIHYAPFFTELPSNVSLNKGEKLRLSCKAKGNPFPKITWAHKDKIIAAQPGNNLMNDLVIERILKEQDGTYTCIAENTVSSVNTTVFVFVRESPVLIGPHHVNLTVPLGGNIILNCIVKGNPIPKIQWNKKGHDILYNKRFKQFNNGSLAIYNSKNEDIGEYTCLATNVAGVLEHTITLSLQKPPMITIHPIDTTVNAGATVVLNCQADGEPEPDVIWSRVTHPISGDNRFTILSNSSLKIVAARKEDTSIYECRATNIMGSIAVKASFTVQVHGGFSDWLPWQACSVTCGQGVEKRIRLCSNPAPANGGLYCQGEESETRICQNKICPVDGSWSDWSPWEECTKTCGSGKKTRTRTCHVPPGQEGGKACLGKAVDTIVCNTEPCPVDGIWSSWQAWGACSKTCGKGTQTRMRVCNNPPPSFDGSPCEGQDTQTQICSDRQCPVDGKWSAWGSWTSCSLSCGGGLRQRFRDCSNPVPQYGGHKCEGKEHESEFCNGDLCPVHGNWGPWSAWGACSRTCSGGQMRRYRACDNPAPSNSGRGCTGADTDIHKCNSNKCPVDGNWGPWEAWSKCSATCGGGQQIRTRLCRHFVESNIVRSCPGDSTQLLKCNVQACQGRAQFIRGTLVGIINDLDIGTAFLNGTISNSPDSHNQIIKAQYSNIPKSLGPSMRNLGSILNPIYWTVAREMDEAVNGFTLTGGEFLRESQVEFATGEVLLVNHTARGLDSDGFLILDTVVKGYILQLQSSTDIRLKEYTEDYIQTGLGQLYAYSTRMFYLDGVSVPYAWNHTISYDPSHGKMPFTMEILNVSPVETDYNSLFETLVFEMRASISKGELGNQCPSGFSYDVSGLYCEDDDECAHNPCSHACYNIIGSYYCSCPKGLMSSADGRTCHDIDECTLEDAVCRKNEECRNTIGSFKCILKCGVGFRTSANGLDCKDINECQELNPCHQRCFNSIGSYHCGCDPGFYLKGRRCFDMNECRQSVCRPDQLCKNTRGSYKCIDLCPSGLSKTENGSCVDINECKEATHWCKNNQICENTHGSYVCVCPRGFRSEGPGKHCVDINECDNQDVCQHECRNILGSYQCVCPPGYQLMANGKSCQDIDECLLQNVQCGINQMCFNMRGSHQCIDTPCPPNYLRDSSSGYCLKNCAVNDVECALSPYALQYKMVSLPFGIAANQDLIRLVAYTQDGILHPRTTFLIIDEDPTLPFSIREENMKGVIFTNRPLKEPETYRMKVRALSYSAERSIEYQTTFIVYISVSPYPY